MNWLLVFLIPICTGVTAGWAGGSLPGHKIFSEKLKFMPEVLFALFMASILYPLLNYFALIPAAWIYLWFQSATWPMLSWGQGILDKGRSSTLKPFVDFCARMADISDDSARYNWLYAEIRGFLITLPIGGLGAFLSPIARELGHRTGNHAITEVLEGFLFGINAALFYILINFLGLI